VGFAVRDDATADRSGDRKQSTVWPIAVAASTGALDGARTEHGHQRRSNPGAPTYV
jgi:hypothetical protein